MYEKSTSNKRKSNRMNIPLLHLWILILIGGSTSSSIEDNDVSCDKNFYDLVTEVCSNVSNADSKL